MRDCLITFNFRKHALFFVTFPQKIILPILIQRETVRARSIANYEKKWILDRSTSPQRIKIIKKIGGNHLNRRVGLISTRWCHGRLQRAVSPCLLIGYVSLNISYVLPVFFIHALYIHVYITPLVRRYDSALLNWSIWMRKAKLSLISRARGIHVIFL